MEEKLRKNYLYWFEWEGIGFRVNRITSCLRNCLRGTVCRWPWIWRQRPRCGKWLCCRDRGGVRSRRPSTSPPLSIGRRSFSKSPSTISVDWNKNKQKQKRIIQIVGLHSISIEMGQNSIPNEGNLNKKSLENE